MMAGVLQIRAYAPPPVDRGEILRYAGMKKDGLVDVKDLLEECIAEVDKKLVYKVVYRTCPVYKEGNNISFGSFTVSSESLRKNLSGCSRVVFFAATVGMELDRLIVRSMHTSAAKALFFQAIGAERIESLCNLLERDIAKEEGELSPRFSPGYGDFSLAAQKDIFALLTPEKTIGLSLTDSLLMTPSKSVTAIVGVKDRCI